MSRTAGLEAAPVVPPEALVATARNYLDGRPMTAGGKTFRRDCSGFVQAVFYNHGVTLVQEHTSDRATATRAIYRLLHRHGLIFRSGTPLPGDVVFFNNTYDKNRDRRLNDRLTHIALIESVDPGGRVTMLHVASSGVERMYMNPRQPTIYRDETGEIQNSFLRKKGPADPSRTPRLTGELFEAYGRVH